MTNEYKEFRNTVHTVLLKKVSIYINITDFVFEDENIDSISSFYNTFHPIMRISQIKRILDSLVTTKNILTIRWIIGNFSIGKTDISLEDLFLRGHLKVIKYLTTAFDIKESDINFFHRQDMSIYENTNKGKWLLKFMKYTKTDIVKRYYIISNICQQGNIEMIEWLIKKYRLSKKEFFQDYISLNLLCQKGNLEAVKWLINKYNVIKEEFFDYQTIKILCEENKLEMLKWLVDRFRLNKTECKFDTESLGILFLHNFEMAKYLFVKFRFNNKDLEEINNGRYTPVEIESSSLIAYSYRNENLEMTKWLIDWLKLSQEDKKSLISYAFRHRNITLIKLVIEKFELTKEDILYNDCELFRKAYNSGYLLVPKYLIGRFQLTKVDLQKVISDIIVDSCKNGLVVVLNWVANEFDLQTSDFTFKNNMALNVARDHKQVNILKYLKDTFGIDILQ